MSLEKRKRSSKNVARTTGAVSHSLSVHDLPGHTKMKFRQQGQAAPGELEKRDLRKELEEREKTFRNFQQIGVRRGGKRKKT